MSPPGNAAPRPLACSQPRVDHIAVIGRPFESLELFVNGVSGAGQVAVHDATFRVEAGKITAINLAPR